MAEPTIIPRAEHIISRRDVDSDALKVLYRLHEHHYIAYLVGGSVRDLLLNRRPKDFDIGTSAHPHQVKKLFRNCWIIGRRFRLAHVKFGPKTIEVATFRRHVAASAMTPEAEVADESPNVPAESQDAAPSRRRADDHLIQRDNTYGTPEEDAFRRDFTVNALFYDIGTFSIIDYVGGLDDLDARVIRCIGDPEVRFLEDPVRMLRAVVLAARLQFSIDPPILEAIADHRHEIARSAPARLVEEYLQDPAIRPREGGLQAVARHRAAEGDHARTGRRGRFGVAVNRRARRLSGALRCGARFVDQRDPGRHAAVPAGTRRATAILSGCVGAACRAGPPADRAARHRTFAANPVTATTPARHAGRRAHTARARPPRDVVGSDYLA